MYALALRLQAFLAARRVSIFLTVGLCLLGLLIRAVWVVAGDKLKAGNSEMFFVTRAFALTGQFADAYRPGSGLTAHVSPVMPWYAGMIYRVFGVGTPAGEIALMVIAMGFIGVSIFAVDAVMRRLESPAPARLAALAFVCLVPMYFTIELQAFRTWEGAVAAAGIALVLAVTMKLDAQETPPAWSALGALALAIGLLSLASQPAALACYGCLGLLALRRRGVVALLATAALSAVLLAAVSYPWAVRNEAIFGEKVWSRTNFGFNFALGFHDAAVDPADPRKVLVDRMAEVDPYTSDKAYDAMKASGGELAYSKYWTERTKTWIAAHPAGAVRIGARHLGEFYFPPRWQWSIYNDRGRGVEMRQAIIWVTTLLGFAAVGWRLLSRDWRALYLTAALLLPAAPYVLAQPILRYRYVVTTLLVYLAADLVWRLVMAALSRTRPAREAAVAS